MENFNTVHIFGFGDVQIIGDDNNGKVKDSELTKLSTFIDSIKAQLPLTGVTLTNYHVIHIFNDSSVRYLGRGTDDGNEKTSFTVEWIDVDAIKLDELITEIISLL